VGRSPGRRKGWQSGGWQQEPAGSVEVTPQTWPVSKSGIQAWYHSRCIAYQCSGSTIAESLVIRSGGDDGWLSHGSGDGDDGCDLLWVQGLLT
jgi:hypothetical protein